MNLREANQSDRTASYPHDHHLHGEEKMDILAGREALRKSVHRVEAAGGCERLALFALSAWIAPCKFRLKCEAFAPLRRVEIF